jgi:hypothetical protein
MGRNSKGRKEGRKQREVSVHERVVHMISRELFDRGYEGISMNREYTHAEMGECGELDVFGLKKYFGDGRKGRKYMVLFEIKQSNNKKNKRKALEQLARGERWLKKRYGKETRVFKFYGFSHKLLRANLPERPYRLEWIRN